MPSNNNNSNWKKKSGSDTIYETTLSLNKYDDPNNPIDKKKGIVISRFNVVDGEIQLFEKKGSTETLMSTIKADGSQSFDSGNLYTTYFDASDSNNRGQQLNQVLDLTKNQAVITAKKELDQQTFSDVYEDSETYKSVSNDSESDPDSPDVSPEPPGTDKMGEYGYRDPTQKGKAIPEGKSVLRYPITVPELGYDFIRITAYEYTAG